jgi:hypothetical protein
MTNEDVHLFGNDPEGIALVQQLQQRAEAWAEAGILTMIFTTDDYWPYETMKKNASRLRVSRNVVVFLSARMRDKAHFKPCSDLLVGSERPRPLPSRGFQCASLPSLVLWSIGRYRPSKG